MFKVNNKGTRIELVETLFVDLFRENNHEEEKY